VVAGIFALIGVLFLISAAFMSGLGSRLIVAAIAFAVAAFLAYCSRAYVLVSPATGTVTIRNPLGTDRIAITGISGFDAELRYTGKTGSQTSSVYLLRTDGKRFDCSGATTTGNYHKCVQNARRLNRAIAGHQGPPRTDGVIGAAQAYAK